MLAGDADVFLSLRLMLFQGFEAVLQFLELVLIEGFSHVPIPVWFNKEVITTQIFLEHPLLKKRVSQYIRMKPHIVLSIEFLLLVFVKLMVLPYF